MGMRVRVTKMVVVLLLRGFVHSKTIVDHLNSGTTIVCDRYAYSGVAFTAFKVRFLNACRVHTFLTDLANIGL
jgi:thymidylate kinase